MASSKQLTDNFLTCSICTEVFTDPCTLQCDHSFCRACITQYLQSRQDVTQSRTIPCPYCRQTARVPDPTRPVGEWAGQIKPSHIILGLMESLDADAKDIAKCSLCEQKGETTPAKHWCCECEISMCDACNQVHGMIPVSCDHDVLDIKEDVKLKKKRKVKCTEHRKNDLEFYCNDCEKAVCHSCCILYHRKCDAVVTVESKCPEMKIILKDKSKRLTEEICDMNSKISENKLLLVHTKQDKSELQSQIKTFCQAARDLITKKEVDLLKVLDRRTDERTGKLQSCIKTAEMAAQRYQQRLQFIQRALESESVMDTYEVYQACQSGKIETDVQTEDADVGLSQEEWRPFINMHADLDKLSTVLDDTYLGVVHVFDPQSSPALYETIGDAGGTDIVVLEVNVITTCVVTYHNVSEIKSFYSRSNTMHHSSLSTDNYAWGLTKVRENQVAVTVPNARQIITVKVTPDLQIVSNIQTPKMYYGLTYLTNNSTFAAGCSDSTCVDILDMSGHLLKTLTNTAVKCPNFILTSETGGLFISDWGKKAVIGLTANGDVACTSNLGLNTFKVNRGIARTSTGHILVADKVADKVVLFTENGEYVRDVLTAKEGMDEPFGLCLHRGLLYVAQWKSGVRVYNFKK
ncbi:tripartite motif-containing protein 65-like [Haliotis rufescens]|uniref:tripartite motif-containing protein 65-like n=1 Tax=Haliotis rufescens TaxID=6454 RepID=UPI00201EC118|nr:tripartite motif-containing protein 65-like [Haliotis rufescens]XP_046346726.2 tripartite motif-containing protein 65-like [Haliotis rufescens]XP_048256765.1 tripartite motif-containing protein 65-like [Haliotis rufescens]